VAFVLGLQVGRIVEKHAEQRRKEANKFGGPIVIGKESESQIGKDLKVFSEEAGKVHPVPPPSADEHLNETEKSLTFRETLAKKDPEPILLEKPSPATKGPEQTAAPHPQQTARFMVQVAAFRNPETAEKLKKQLIQDGFKTVVEPRGGYHKVIVGPYQDKGAANQTIRKLKAKWKVDPFLVRR
jgi:cell division protein FtsN